MSWFEFDTRTEEPDVLIVSQRKLWPVVSRCLLFQFEDFIASHHAADIVAPVEPAIRKAGVRRAVRRLDRVLPAATRVFARPPPSSKQKYSVLFVSCEQLADLMQLGSLAAWKELADVSVCYVEELWRHRLSTRTGELALVRQFDHVFVGCEGAVEALEEIIGRPCHYLPPSVDTLALCPYPRAPRRTIDFYAMGRRASGLHKSLMRMSADRDFFYLYDTTQNARVVDHREHRERLATLIQRTRYFLANWARFPDLDVTNGQKELGLRFFEGAAGGTVMIGEPPDTRAYDELFDWEDAVIRFPLDSIAIEPLIASLDCDPTRVDAIRRRNVVQSLSRHDFAHRWRSVLAALGRPCDERLATRFEALADRASAVESGARARRASPEAA